MARLDTEKQAELEPKRIAYAEQKIIEAGGVITDKNGNRIKFTHKGREITVFPYSGWHTGKGIKDGRGIDNLLKQLK